MARNDFICTRQVEDGMGFGSINTTISGAQTFLEGEPLTVSTGVNGGWLVECANDPIRVVGIAAAPSQGKNANGTALGTRPDGTIIQFYKPASGQLFVTTRLSTDGAGTTVITSPNITRAYVGDTAGFALAGGIWYVDTGCANIHVEIVAIADSTGAIIGDPTRPVGDGVYVVFGFIL